VGLLAGQKEDNVTREEVLAIVHEVLNGLGSASPGTSPPVVGPAKPYGEEVSQYSAVLAGIVNDWCVIVSRRGRKYSLSLYYQDLAWLIRRCIADEVFTESLPSWEEWAKELDDRAAGISPGQFSMTLPEFTTDLVTMTSTLDLIVRYMVDVIKQEAEDSDIVKVVGEKPMQLTMAECAKISQRFTSKLEDFLYTLEPNYPGSNVMVKVPWPLIVKAAEELRHAYKSLGEVDRAGSTGTPGGPMPPVSWPG
jgi:hypothetical protein